jgi:hypothetical protein
MITLCSKCLELFAHWVGWKEEREHKSDLPPVDRFEINRFVQARENTE